MDRSMRIGIVGAGISGVTLAHELVKKGYRQVTLLEKSDRAGGKCHSIEYKGKTYEMGALIGLPSYRHTLKLMEEYGLSERGPLLERAFFNPQGAKISQIPMEQMSEFAREFKRLPELFGRYEAIKQPGFGDIPPELCRPFAVWCEQNQLPVLKQVFMHYFSAFGFGSIEEVPAVYVMKLLNYENLISFIEITHMISWPQGVSKLVKVMADAAPDLRLTCRVRSIHRDASGEMRVETDHETLHFERLIYTAPLRGLRNKLQGMEPQDRGLLELITHEPFRVYAYRAERLPKMSGYIPGNMGDARAGQMMAWYYRWGDLAENDLVTVYVKENGRLSDPEIRANIESTLAGLGGKEIRLHMMKRWDHFPHVGTAALENGFYRRLEELQGKYGVYFAGEIMNFPTLENCIAYAKTLITRYF